MVVKLTYWGGSNTLCSAVNRENWKVSVSAETSSPHSESSRTGWRTGKEREGGLNTFSGPELADRTSDKTFSSFPPVGQNLVASWQCGK